MSHCIYSWWLLWWQPTCLGSWLTHSMPWQSTVNMVISLASCIWKVHLSHVWTAAIYWFLWLVSMTLKLYILFFKPTIYTWFYSELSKICTRAPPFQFSSGNDIHIVQTDSLSLDFTPESGFGHDIQDAHFLNGGLSHRPVLQGYLRMPQNYCCKNL